MFLDITIIKIIHRILIPRMLNAIVTVALYSYPQIKSSRNVPNDLYKPSSAEFIYESKQAIIITERTNVC